MNVHLCASCDYIYERDQIGDWVEGRFWRYHFFSIEITESVNDLIVFDTEMVFEIESLDGDGENVFQSVLGNIEYLRATWSVFNHTHVTRNRHFSRHLATIHNSSYSSDY